MDWNPLSREELDAMIRDGLESADDDVLRAWSAMRIEPEKWRCHPWGDAGGGFWAVAVRDGSVTWYNDIEDGFNTSLFDEHGVIKEYHCNQRDFLEYLATLPEALAAETEEVAGATELVPETLAGRGRIAKRQTTYWTLERDNRRCWRVHFRGKVEIRLDGAHYSSIELHQSHPVLRDYTEPAVSLYFRGKAENPRELEQAVADIVCRMTDGWRDIRTYCDPRARLAQGFGIFMLAPKSVAAAVRLELEKAGLACSVLSETAPSKVKRALLLGQSFIVAESFRFERIET